MKIEFYKDKFKEFRKLKGISMLELAEIGNISRKSVSIWEKGERQPNPKYIRILAKALNVDISEISNMQPENKLSAIELSKTRDTLISYVNKEHDLNDKINYALNIILSLKDEIGQINFILKALTSALDSIFYIKDKDCKYVIVNEAFLKNISLHIDYKAIGKIDKDFFAQKEAELNTNEDKSVISSGHSIINKEDYILGSRKKKIGLISKIPIMDSEGDSAGLIAIFTDITHQKEAEKHRILLEKVIDGTGSNIFIVRKTNKPRQPLELLFVNEKTLNLLGLTRTEVPDLTRLWLTETPKHFNRLLDKISNAKSFPINYKYHGIHSVRKKLSYLSETVYNPFEDYYLVVINDMTEEFKKNEAISFLESVLANTIIWEGYVNEKRTDILFKFISENKNKVSEYITNYNKSELLSFKSFIPVNDYVLFSNWLKQIESNELFNHWLLRTNGTKVFCETKIILKKKSNILYCIGTTTVTKKNNITEIALKLKEKEIATDIIAYATGLSVEEIEKI
jgi:transcriptional regulator with XRE-family HTH domain